MIYQELMLVVRVSHLFVTSFEMSGGEGGGGGWGRKEGVGGISCLYSKTYCVHRRQQVVAGL